jgi:hypothetical protein
MLTSGKCRIERAAPNDFLLKINLMISQKVAKAMAL